MRDISATNFAANVSGGRPLRLLIVSDYAYPSGGIEHFVKGFIGAVSKRFECQLLSWNGGVLTPPGFENLTAIECGDIRQAWSLMDWAEVLLVPTSFNVRMLARLTTEYVTYTPKPIVTVVHTSSHSNRHASSVNVQDIWLTELLNRSAHIVTVSRAVDEAVRALPLEPGKINRMSIIENAARISTNGSPAKDGTRRSQVSFIGRPFPQKGFDLFILLAHDLRNLGLTFAANTVSVPLQEPIEDISLSALLSDDELVAFFEQTDLLIVPYLYADGLPLAILEALNCGVPIIGFDSPSVGPLLRRYSQVVIPANYAALRDAVQNWHAGRLSVASPRAGMVPSWDEAFAQYINIIEAIGAHLDV